MGYYMSYYNSRKEDDEYGDIIFDEYTNNDNSTEYQHPQEQFYICPNGYTYKIGDTFKFLSQAYTILKIWKSCLVLIKDGEKYKYYYYPLPYEEESINIL